MKTYFVVKRKLSFNSSNFFSNIVLTPIVGFLMILSDVLIDNSSSIDDGLKCNKAKPSISSSKVHENILLQNNI